MDIKNLIRKQKIEAILNQDQFDKLIDKELNNLKSLIHEKPKKMIQIRLYLCNALWMDERVSIDIELPFVPKKGDSILLTDNIIESITSIVNSSQDILNDYIEYWESDEDNSKVDLGNRALYVTGVQYTPNSPIVQIEIGSCDNL